MQNNNKVILELKNLTKIFGGLSAVEDVSLRVNSGEIMGLIGPNGAGKTTLFNLVSGVMKETRGNVFFQNEDVTEFSPNQLVKKGLIRTFQGNVHFKNSTVIDNVLMGCHVQTKVSFFGSLFNTRYTCSRESELLKSAIDIIDFLGLTEYRNELAKNLPHGYQRALGIAIALASDPKFLMLDEPAAGMNAEETETLMDMLRQIRKEKGITILLVEHDMKMVMGICDRIAVLNFGKKIAEGIPEQIRANQDVIEAYLGVEDDEIA
ncbi:MAG: ABC transporter ATP-binding protein [Dethiobacter sp.]|jgi:branched-chain amino acid transport system ATP-binding protein|nr:ABC transporter ATP-binding protein [Dethiobacter sp.]